jgi:hypothetical protein
MIDRGSSCSADGVSDFDAPDSREYYKWAQYSAFDMLAGDGEDLLPLPLSLQKAEASRSCSREVLGIFIAEYEQGDIGDALFRVTPRSIGAETARRCF